MATKSKKTTQDAKKADIKLSEMMPAELVSSAKELREKIAAANLERIAGKAKDVRLGYKLHKQLARTLTVLKEKTHD